MSGRNASHAHNLSLLLHGGFSQMGQDTITAFFIGIVFAIFNFIAKYAGNRRLATENRNDQQNILHDMEKIKPDI